MKRLALTLLVILFTATSVQVTAQTKAEIKKQRESEKEAEVKQLLESGSYQFVANQAQTTLKSKPFMTLSPGYSLQIEPSKIKSHLPFYGQAYSSPMGSTGSPLSFESTNFKLTSKTGGKKNESTIVAIEAKVDDRGITVIINLEIFPNGTATLSVNRYDLSRMSYYGEIQKTDLPELQK